jgi:nitrous oxide reductase accessory protein NosL
MRAASLLLPALLVAACGGGAPEPVELLLDEEECSLCRMAVSRRPFAAEAVTPAGSVHFFDDIGCLARWTVEQPPPPGTALFVVDYATGVWLDATAARYVRAERLETPMASGLAAFASAERAAAEASNLGGRVVDWAAVVGEARP